MARKRTNREYLAFLTVKYDIDPDTLYQALTSARENGEAKIRNLSVERRGETETTVFFLIKEGTNIVAQLPISKEFLERNRNPINNFMENEMIDRYISAETQSDKARTIEDLRSGMRDVELKAKVLEISKPRYLNTRYGNQACLAKALLEDETGEIRLCLWNEQMDMVKEGDHIQIEHARVATFRGQKQLSLGKKGTVKKINDAVDVQVRQVVPQEA